MMFTFIRTMLLVLIVSSSMISNNANAGIIFEDITDVTRDRQIYRNTFDVTGFEDYTNIQFNVIVRGDYSSRNGEYIGVRLNNNSYNQFYSDTPGVVVSQFIEDRFLLDHDTIMSFSMDVSQENYKKYFFPPRLEFQVFWQNGDNVYYGRFGDNGERYVSFTLTGDPIAAPEPSTLAILALGMIGLASRRFKK